MVKFKAGKEMRAEVLKLTPHGRNHDHDHDHDGDGK